MSFRPIDYNLIRSKSFFIATPLYGAVAQYEYMVSMFGLIQAAMRHSLTMHVQHINNDSLISRARNNLAHKFLSIPNCDYLVFIDGDIGFTAEDVFYTIQLMIQNPEMKVVTAAYPQKWINWEGIHKANKAGLINISSDYEKFSGVFGTNPITDKDFSLSEPYEVNESSTGFMVISKEVFEQFNNSFPEKMYLQYVNNEKRMAYFDCMIHPESNRYLSEDYAFCYFAKKMGYKIWVLPWVTLSHTGNHTFRSTYADVAIANKVYTDMDIE